MFSWFVAGHVYDSDVISSSGHESSTSIDSCSYEEAVEPNYNEQSDDENTNNQCLTQPMSKGARISMKRNLLILNMALQTAISDVISESFLGVWCANKLRVKYDDPYTTNLFRQLIVKIQCHMINTMIVFVDEMINHNKHQWSYMDSESDALWKAEDWWTQYYAKFWLKQNTELGVVLEDLTKVAGVKRHFFIDNVNHEKVWEKVDTWIMESDIDQLILKYNKQQIALSNIPISPNLLDFFHQLTTVLTKHNLCSQIEKLAPVNDDDDDSASEVEEKTFVYQTRQYELNANAEEWLHAAYMNKNSLIYRLTFDAWDQHKNKMKMWLQNGITADMDVKVPLVLLSKNSNVQKCILFSMAFMRMKYLMFRNLIPESIDGNFSYTNQTFHYPLQRCVKINEKILFAHYFQPAANDEINEVDIDNEMNSDLQPVTATQKMRIQFQQEHKHMGFLYALCNTKIPADRIYEIMLCMHEENNLWTIPTSCGWATNTKTNMKRLKAKTSHIWTGGYPYDTKKEWEKEKQKCALVRINAMTQTNPQYETQRMINIKQIITNTLCAVSCLWNCLDKHNQNRFKTAMTDIWCQKQYWKYTTVKPVRWNSMADSNQVFPLTINNKFYGYKWLYRDYKQVNAFQSIQYTTFAAFAAKIGLKVLDYGMKVHGNLWNPLDIVMRDDQSSQGTKKGKDEWDDATAEEPPMAEFFEEAKQPKNQITMNNIIDIANDDVNTNLNTLIDLSMENENSDEQDNDINVLSTSNGTNSNDNGLADMFEKHSNRYRYIYDAKPMSTDKETNNTKNNKNVSFVNKQFDQCTPMSFIAKASPNTYKINGRTTTPYLKKRQNTCQNVPRRRNNNNNNNNNLCVPNQRTKREQAKTKAKVGRKSKTQKSSKLKSKKMLTVQQRRQLGQTNETAVKQRIKNTKSNKNSNNKNTINNIEIPQNMMKQNNCLKRKDDYQNINGVPLTKRFKT